MISSTALYISITIFLSVSIVQAQNSTVSTANSGNAKVGWHDGPNQRGTLTLLWSCLSTVIACTWTILHLNVPGQSDSLWIKIGRKAKWMIITILFPEFVFSKAICELQMAVDDLQAMKEKEGVIKWTVTFGCRLKNLHKLFHLFDNTPASETIDGAAPGRELMILNPAENTSPAMTVSHSTVNSYDPDLSPEKERLWTLTHSYFANMGGLERYKSPEGLSPLTAHGLVNCCVGTNHDPLPTLDLPKKDIEDKIKADWFLKSVAIAQISWFLLSVIVRAVEKLPISQLEICTTAFTTLGVATYIANWSKPKDVGVAVRFKLLADTYDCEAYKHPGEPFYHRLTMPSERDLFCKVSRIRNDFVRLEGFMPPMAVTMAISTAMFGGLHCLAWNFEFPTETELMIWMVVSVASATIPTATLIVNIIIVRSIWRAIRKFSLEFSKRFEEWDKDTPHDDKSHLNRRQTLGLIPQDHSKSSKTEYSLLSAHTVVKTWGLLLKQYFRRT